MVRTPTERTSGILTSGRFQRGRRRPVIGLAFVTIGIVAAACGGSTSGSSSTTTTSSTKATSSTSSTTKSSTHSSSSATVDTADIPGLGTVLVNSSGRTLYLFTTDKQATPTCTGSCATAWPLLAANGTPTAGSGVGASLLGTVHNPNGSTQVTYNRWPLYTFIGDSGPGVAHGQGNFTSGGYWWVLNPQGMAVEAKASSTTSTSSGGGGSGY